MYTTISREQLNWLMSNLVNIFKTRLSACQSVNQFRRSRDLHIAICTYEHAACFMSGLTFYRPTL